MSGTGEMLEGGDPAADSRAFRRSLGMFATGVTVVTARAGDALVGVTANSFTSVSLDPPLVLWSIDKASTSLPVFMAGTHFAVNVLAQGQMALSNHFAKTAPDKFDAVDWTPGAGGAPLIPGTAAVFECRRAVEHDAGDHILMVGHVERHARFDRDVLLFHGGKYKAATAHPDAG